MTPQGAAVSNQFRVNDFDEFKQGLRAHFSTVEVEVHDQVGDAEIYPGQTRVSLHAVDGYWPSEPDDTELMNEDLFGFISDYVVSGELAILHSVSFQGPADVRFQSISIAEHDRIRTIELDQVEAFHRVAQSMGR